MTKVSPSSPLSEQEIITQIKTLVFGQEAVVHAVAAEFARRHASHPADRPIGVFLLAGPDVARGHLSIAGSLGEVLQASATAYILESDWGQDPRLLFTSGLARRASLVDHLKAHPGSLVVFDTVEMAHPQVIEQLQAAWRTGVLRDQYGEAISAAGAMFVLMTNVGQELIGQLARHEADSDRLHVEGLKILLDAGFPAAILTSIDRVFCLRSNTPGELARDRHRRLIEEVELHGLQVAAGGIDARILIDVMSPVVGPYASAEGSPLDDIYDRLAAAKEQGMKTVRLILGEREVEVVSADEREVGA